MRQEMRDLLASQRGMFAGVQLVEAGAQPGGAPGGMPGAAPGAPGMAPPLGAGAMAGGPMSLPPSGGAGSDPVAPFGEAGDILDRAAGWITDTFGSGWSNALGTMPQDMRNMMEYMAATAPGAIVARLMGGGSTAGGPGSASQTGGHDWLDDYSQWFTDNVPYGKELTDAVSPYAHSALNMIMSDEELANANPFDLATYTTMAAIPVALGIYYAVPLGASYASAAAWQVGMRLSAMAPTAVTWAISPVGQRVIGAGTGAVLTGIGAYNNGASLSEAAGLTVLDFFMNGGTYGGFKNDYGSPPLGARGPTSGREFDPLSAGGPVRNLSTGGMKITSRGIDVVEQHLSRFGPDAPNQGMVQRLRDIASGKLPPTEADLNFYAHELREFVRYRSLGWPTGQPPEPDAAYELWNNAHTATLEDYGLQEGPGVLYHPSVEH